MFSNKTPADIICEKEFRHYLGDRCILTCTRDAPADYANRRIDKSFIEEYTQSFDQRFYVCGPPKFVDNVKENLSTLGANPDALVFEE